jgi:hypothetical protein
MTDQWFDQPDMHAAGYQAGQRDTNHRHLREIADLAAVIADLKGQLAAAAFESQRLLDLAEERRKQMLSALKLAEHHGAKVSWRTADGEAGAFRAIERLDGSPWIGSNPCGDAFEGRVCHLAHGHATPHSDYAAEWGSRQ